MAVETGEKLRTFSGQKLKDRVAFVPPQRARGDRPARPPQHLLDRRPDREHRTDEPCGVEVRHVRVATVPEKVLDGIRRQVPLGRLGRADEVARVVHFLCADASAYITGQVWAVNGGPEL
jgi:NAD(P)-dependent dehydrogenase (short-subunit alcohol dehydrogenase family)